MSRHEARLRIITEERTLEALEDLLGPSAQGGHTMGAPRGSSGRFWESTIWFRVAEVETDWLEDQINELLTWIDDHLETFECVRSFSKADLFCLLRTRGEQAGFILDEKMSGRMHRFGLRLVIDVHSED